MIFAVVGIAWMVMALAMGSLLGRSVATADRRESSTQAVTSVDTPLYVADILRAQRSAA
ncbi:hypothetical protein [Modestobacter marinus]|uniref:hypothetical protein n=1 Tax=Modestobacter marinus TaxID=477641 RepID=UPI001C96A065|nr:hypothetical protein [Modestobacter marinus]